MVGCCLPPVRFEKLYLEVLKMTQSRTLRAFAATMVLILTTTILTTAAPAAAAGDHGEVVIDGLSFESLLEYYHSDYFQASGRRCDTPDFEMHEILFGLQGGDPSDCSLGATNPTSEYDPDVLLEIPVVVHIIMNSSCTAGVISDELVHSQIDILNEDFLALGGTPGENGNDAQVQFVLATEDPDGQPATGITRSCNSTWFGDNGAYWNTLAWDPHRYMNIYTNNTGALGYVPFLPQTNGGANVGSLADRVVVTWEAFGRDAPTGPPYDQGRTATHEVGHYLGLHHTFNAGCGNATPPGCYTSGDRICDTNAEANPTFRPCFVGAKSTCGSVDPSDNYMDYSDDVCMMQFTPEQLRRMRCTLEFYRPDVYSAVEVGGIFDDNFEAGNANIWGNGFGLP